MKRRSFLILPLATALPHRARAAGPEVTDVLGRVVPLKAMPERIVIIFNYEEFTAVGGTAAWDRVVGLGRKQWAGYRAANWTRYLAAIPRLGDLADVGIADDKSFSIERTMALRPDLLIAHEFAFRTMAPLMRQLEEAGVPIIAIDYNAQELDRHVTSTLAIGTALGTTDRARALAELYRARTADTARRIQGLPPRRVYVEAGPGGAGVFGNTYSGAMWGRMIEQAGGTNVATGKIPTGWAAMNPEAVLAAAPEHVFILGSSWANSPNAVRAGYDADIDLTRRTLAPYADRPGWSGLPAIQTGELHAIETGLARSLWDWTATQYIARQVHPAAFADADPVAGLREYHETFLPVRFEGTWMARVRA